MNLTKLQLYTNRVQV